MSRFVAVFFLFWLSMQAALAQQAPEPLTEEEFALILAEFDALVSEDTAMGIIQIGAAGEPSTSTPLDTRTFTSKD